MVSSVVWKLATALALVVALYAIWDNGADIEQVCEFNQRQTDRNAATLQRSLDGLRMIRDMPERANKLNVSGFDYYVLRPAELASAIHRTRAELAIYQTEVC